MIELRTDLINDDTIYEIIIRSKETDDPKYITLTGADVKKLVAILNLSIGHNPNGMKLDDLFGWLGMK